MDETCDVAIVGAGVIGCSIAFHLARMGKQRVRLLERETVPGAGSTSKANGGIRAQFTTDVNVRMSLASMDVLDALAPEIGDPPVYKKAGYLFVTSDPAKLRAMQSAAAYQRERGVTVEVLDARGVRGKAPWLAGRIAGGTFGARDGFIDPGGLCNFFLREATRGGAAIRYGAEVTGIEPRSSGWTVRTTAGTLEAGAVVNAAGPWARKVAQMVGIDLPVEPVRRHLLMTGPCSTLPKLIPMTIDADTGVLVRREGDRILIAYSNPDEPAGFNTVFDPAFAERIAAPVEDRFPAVGEAGIDRRKSWAGLYEVTPDHHAVLGPAPRLPGFFLANGFSGHGVMHSPAAGRAIAELILRGRSESVDIAPLSIERFESGALIHERMVL